MHLRHHAVSHTSIHASHAIHGLTHATTIRANDGDALHPDATPDDADNPRTRSEYDAAGQLTASIDERGQRTTYRYDLAGRQIEVKNALNQTMTTSYDVAGQRTQVTDALGRGTKFVYDAAGRLTETIHPDATAGDADNPRTRMAYDAAGRKIAETDEMGRTTRFAYDKLSRLVAVVLPNPATGANPELIDDASPDAGTLTTRYQYDEQGNKIAQIDAEGRTTRWTYDRQGRGLTRTLPMGQSESFQYDSHGQRVQHTTFNGEAIATAYDNLGRPTTVTLPGKTRTFSYDAGNRVTSIQEGADTYSFQYDVRDRLTRATDAQNRSIDYAYDAIGNRTRLSTPRQHVDYTYDELNRLTEVIAILDQGRAQTTSYAYDGVGNRAGQTHPNGTTVAYTYDERNRLKTLLHKASAAANAAILLSLSYSVDASGLRTQIAETRPNPTANQPAITRTTDYQYDAVKRLMREQVTGTQSQGRTTVFTYDKVGNRKTEATSGTLSKNQTLTYDNNDRLTRVAGTGGTIDHVYDNAGNLIEKKQGTTTLERYTFDAEGRLTTATIGTGASQKVLSYRYDPNGIRRSQHVETSTGQARAEYLVDPNQAYAQVLEEYETQAATGQALPASTLATTYVYGDDLISQTQLALAGNTTHVYHYDGLGTTRALSAHNLDAQGNPVTTGPNAHATITDRYAYTAFGENDPAGTSGNTTGTTENNYRYTGEQLDPNLGFYYLRARYMDPRVGRFVGMDEHPGTDSDPISTHRFQYAHHSPISNTDPSGFETLAGQSTAMNATVRNSLNASINTFRTFANRAVSYTIQTTRAARQAVRKCLRDTKKCPLAIPTLVVGRNFPNAALHIQQSQLGHGTNMVGAGFLYTYLKRKKTAWYNRYSECSVFKRKVAEARFGGMVGCDEFPFFASRQGGPENYPGKVSLRFIPYIENRQVGLLFAGMVSASRMKTNDHFLVVADPDIEISLFIPFRKH